MAVECRRGQAPSQAEADALQRAICDALLELRHEEVPWNEATFTFPTIAGTDEYGAESAPGAGDGYPSTILRIDSLVYPQSGVLDPLVRIPWEEIVWLKTTDSITGYPTRWAWQSRKIILFPTPNAAVTMRGRGAIDVGLPTYSYDPTGSTWSFFKPNGDPMDDAYTSDWFVEGEGLLRQWAKGRFYLDYLHDDEAAKRAMALARGALGSVKRQLANIQGEPQRTPRW
jgi:hypothetical protein